MKKIIAFLLITSLSLLQLSAQNPISRNPGSGASVTLDWNNNIPRIRYGGTGVGAANGFQIQGPQDQVKFTVSHTGYIGIGTSSPSEPIHVVDETSGLMAFGRAGNETNNRLTLDAASGFENQIYFRSAVGRIFTGGKDLILGNRDGANNLVIVGSNGRVGIGTNRPQSGLTVNKDITFGLYKSRIPSRLAVYDNSTNPQITALVSGSAGGTLMEASGYGQFVIGIRDNNRSDGFHIVSTSQEYSEIPNGSASPYNKLVASFLANGKVGIGTNNPENVLDVVGTIRSTEVIVEATPWPDFVFTDDHKIKTLEEVEHHIFEYGHLPEIPSETEVAENGIKLGEMDAKLLQKIEELTLYLIEQNKEIIKLKEKVNRLENE